MVAGRPILYTYGGTKYAGIVTAVSSNTSITIGGAALDTGQQITLLEYGPYEKGDQIHLHVASTYADGNTSTLYATDEGKYYRFNRIAYVVGFQAIHKTADGVAQPFINLMIGGNAFSTENSGKGTQLSTGGTWVSHSAVAVDTDYYAATWNTALELKVTQDSGADGAAADLTVNVFVVYL